MSARATRRRGGMVGSTRVRDRARLSERMDRGKRMRLWLRSSWPDYLLVLVVATAVSLTVSFAFHSAWAWRGNVVLVAAMCAPLLAALFAGTWSKRAVVPSAVAAVAIVAAYAALATALSPDPALFAEVEGAHYPVLNDVEGNYALFAIVVSVCTVVAFLLSRRTVELVFLLVAVIVACGAVQYLYRDWTAGAQGLAATVAALLGVGMLFVYQCYKQSVYSANRAKRTTFGGAFAFSALVAAVCVLVGGGVFYGVVAASDLTTPDWRPFESHVSPPIDERANTYERSEVEGDETSDETSDEIDGDDEVDEGGDSSQAGGLGLFENTLIASAAAALAGFDPDDLDQDYQNIAYLIVQWEMVIAGALVALALLAAVLVQRARRGLRLRRIARRSNAYQAWYIYTFLVGRLARLHMAKPAHLTPLEFAVGFSKPMLPFTRGAGDVDFVEVSAVYQDAAFGGIGPSDEELARVKRYYRAFFRNARAKAGWPRWVLYKFWRI